MNVAVTAINNVGQIVGNANCSGVNQPFVETSGTFTLLDVPNARDSSVLGINDEGVVVGEYLPTTSAYDAGFVASPTPEPSALLLALAALAGLAVFARKRAISPRKAAIWRYLRVRPLA